MEFSTSDGLTVLHFNIPSATAKMTVILRCSHKIVGDVNNLYPVLFCYMFNREYILHTKFASDKWLSYSILYWSILSCKQIATKIFLSFAYKLLKCCYSNTSALLVYTKCNKNVKSTIKTFAFQHGCNQRTTILCMEIDFRYKRWNLHLQEINLLDQCYCWIDRGFEFVPICIFALRSILYCCKLWLLLKTVH